MARRGGFPGMGGNMANLMKQAQKMQKQMEEAKREIEEMEVTISAGGGSIEVTMNGKKELLALKIDPEAVDPDDVEMLQDMIVAGINEAMREIDKKSSNTMSGFDLGGFGF